MRPPILRLHADELVVDNFAGGGGASTGIEWAIGRSPDIAINHDPEAIAMHKANHPTTQHYISNVWEVDPKKACGGKPVGLAWFSPDCTFFSKARGAKPYRDRNSARRRRGLAWVIVRWMKAVGPRIVAMENVEEFQDWGPLDENGFPDPKKRGTTFRKFVKRCENLGYKVEFRQLRACDYGAPTTRKRLFGLMRRDGLPIVWPEATHGPERPAPYRTAAECIDWSIPCPSIFDRARPLADNTMRRIARGVKKYVIDAAKPFIVPVSHSGDARVHSTEEPLRAVTGSSRSTHAVVQPYLVEYHSARRDGDHRTKPVDAPLPVQDTSNRFAIIAPTLIVTGNGERPGQEPRANDIRAPMRTVTATGSQGAVVAAFLAQHNNSGKFKDGSRRGLAGHPADEPLSTIVTKGCTQGLVAAHVMKMKGNPETHPNTAASMDEPLGTVCAKGTHYAQVCAFLLTYFGTDQDPRIEDPMHTITTKHRHALATVVIDGQSYAIVDIGMRMLEPKELFAAQSFPPDYQIAPVVETVDKRGKKKRGPLSKTAQVRMCGNAVPPAVPAALLAANC